MNERDLRQVEKMKQQIASYQIGAIGLQSLIGDLIFLRDALSAVPEDWEYEFTDRVVDLESAYSYVLEKGMDSLDSMTQGIVDNALVRLSNLIDQLH